MVLNGNGNCDPRKKSKWWIFAQILKYGAAIVVAVVSFYAARQEKAEEADKTAKKALVQLEASYKEQSRQIEQLQNELRKVYRDRRNIVRSCKSEVDRMRDNMTFFLMGESKARRGQIKPQQQLLGALLKKAARADKIVSSPKPPKFSKPRPYNQIMQYRK